MGYFQIFFVLVLGALLNDGPRNVSSSRRRASYIVCCLTLFWLMAALRNVSWAASLHLDAGGYASHFASARLMSWGGLFESFVNRYRYHLTESDIGYDILCKVIGIITDDYNVFSLIVDLMFFIPFGYLLYKYTIKVRQLIVAMLFYVALVQVHMISGARQMFALGLDIMAMVSMMEGKRARSFTFFLLGVTIHFSSMLMIVPLLMILYEADPIVLKRLHLGALFLVPIVLMFPNQVIVFIANAFSMEKYANYGVHAIQGGANTFIVLIELLSVFCYVALSRAYLDEHGDLRKLYVTVPLFTITGPLIHSSGSMIRICLYFYIYLVILFPYGIDRAFDRRSQTAVYGFVILMLVFLVLRGETMDYHFMWQSLY